MRVVEGLVHTCKRNVEIVCLFGIPALASGKYPERLWRRALGEYKDDNYATGHEGGDREEVENPFSPSAR